MRRKVRNNYTAAERSALVGKVERMYQAGGRSYTDIACELGIGETSYHNWVKRGVQASKPAEVKSRLANRYTQEQQRHLLKDIARLHAGGLGFKAACFEVGIAHSTYLKWLEARTPVPTMRQVTVTALVPVPTASIGLNLVAPGGYRVEGLSIESAAALLRALA